MNTIVVALITSGLSLLGVIFTNVMSNRKIEQNLSTAQAITDEKIDQLRKNVEKHNSVIERTFKLEQKQAVQSEQIKTINHQLEVIESKI